MTEAGARRVLAALIADLRLIAGRSGTEEFLERLRALDVYSVEALAEHPQPMFFNDAWGELLDVLLAEARKA